MISVAAKLPTPGTSKVSTTLPVGNNAPTLPTACGSLPPEGALASLGRPGAVEMTPPSSPSSAGSMNSSATSAAAKVTPSSSKSPVSCT
ncbi:hypothetical protein D3C71_1979130 [compost metagenome]